MMSSDDIYQQAKGGYVSDELLGTFLPIVVYWVYSGLYLMLGDMNNYRLHSKKDEDEKNLVSKKEVVKGVLLQQVVQAAVATVLFAGSRSSVKIKCKMCTIGLSQLILYGKVDFEVLLGK